AAHRLARIVDEDDEPGIRAAAAHALALRIGKPRQGELPDVAEARATAIAASTRDEAPTLELAIALALVGAASEARAVEAAVASRAVPSDEVGQDGAMPAPPLTFRFDRTSNADVESVL